MPTARRQTEKAVNTSSGIEITSAATSRPVCRLRTCSASKTVVDTSVSPSRIVRGSSQKQAARRTAANRATAAGCLP